MYISVIPSIRTPLGVEVFDYEIDEDADILPGDLIRVPFRRRQLPALVFERKSSSAHADKALHLKHPEHITRFSSVMIALLEKTAARTFCSKPTILHSWLRAIPKRTTPFTSTESPKKIKRSSKSILTTERFTHVMNEARVATGRVLIVTPWQHRATQLAKHLKAPVLHTHIAPGQAWSSVRNFLEQSSSCLVTTRLGAWLSHAADVVILDEPENDDHKQDELAPRFDVRWMIETCEKLRPNLSVIRVGTTPCLADQEKISVKDIPDIDLTLHIEAWQRDSRSAIEGLSSETLRKIQDATDEGRRIMILHPIHGERGRATCRDCGWQATCEACSYPISPEAEQARCLRCGHTQDVPIACPSCSGSDLTKSRIGRTKLERLLKQHLPDAKLSVHTLSEWYTELCPSHALIVITDVSLVGGYAEDIRKRERLVISWRRLAATVSRMESELIVQGPGDVVDHLRAWLTPQGLIECWKTEWNERNLFGYPPAKQVIKCIVDGTLENAEKTISNLQGSLPESWKIRGPFPVAYRAASRPRAIFHILPETNADEHDVWKALNPATLDAMIDLDPIAFFS